MTRAHTAPQAERTASPASAAVSESTQTVRFMNIETLWRDCDISVHYSNYITLEVKIILLEMVINRTNA